MQAPVLTCPAVLVGARALTYSLWPMQLLMCVPTVASERMAALQSLLKLWPGGIQLVPVGSGSCAFLWWKMVRRCAHIGCAPA